MFMRKGLIILSAVLFLIFDLYAGTDIRDIGKIDINPRFGEIIKKHISDNNNRFIIHIQEAHGNYDAQKSVAGILEQLIKQYGISLVLVEGGSGNDNLTYLREFALKERRILVAEEYLKNGEISGEEYLDLTSDYNFMIYGIEDKYLYNQNMCVFAEVEPLQKPILAEIGKLEAVIGHCKKKYFPKEILELDNKQKDREAKIISLPEYVSYLQKLCPEINKPNIKKYLESMKLENEIDFSKVDEERTKLIEVLVQLVSKETLKTILLNSTKFKIGQINEKDFYEYLIQIGDNLRLDWLQYPMFYKYWEYVNKINCIDNIQLFSEIEAWEDKIKEDFLKEPVQKKLSEIDSDANLLKKLISLELSPDEEGLLEDSRFIINDWVAFLKENTDLPIYVDAAIINNDIPKFRKFYWLARQRDIAFVENSLKWMRQEKQDRAVLIAGGFHTENLARQLEGQQISYVIIKPKFNIPEGERTNLYYTTLKKKWR